MRIVTWMMTLCVCCVAYLTFAALGCGYKMQAADFTTLQKMAPNCAANVAMLTDSGLSIPPATLAQLRSTDRTCNCGARGILACAGQAEPDAGKAGCPQ